MQFGGFKRRNFLRLISVANFDSWLVLCLYVCRSGKLFEIVVVVVSFKLDLAYWSGCVEALCLKKKVNCLLGLMRNC